MAAKITDVYTQSGYFVAQAYLPAQDIQNGVVTITVVEGRYGQIAVRNQSNLSDNVIGDTLDGLNTGDAVVSGPLERRLLLLSDIPGVQVSSTLVPGADVGTSDLIVGVTQGSRVTGSVEADNSGNPYTGVYRLGGSININEPLGWGDVLTARFLASTNGGLDYGRISYQGQLEDATIGIAYTAFAYSLDRQFSSLHASGDEQIASVYGSYPLIRSYTDNLFVTVDFDFRTFQDKIDATFTVTDKQAWVAIVGLNGDHRDDFGGGGLNAYSVAASFGDLDIQTPEARAVDQLTARSNGGYVKFAFSASRLQHIYGPLSLYGAIRGQVASTNLDISEKMELGGAYGVRAYPEGEAYGDQGYIGTLEARLLLPRWIDSLPGDVQLAAFVDSGGVTVNKTPWFDGRNGDTRSGIGVGLTWADTNNFAATIAYAHEIGDIPATSAPDRFGRFWVQLVKYF